MADIKTMSDTGNERAVVQMAGRTGRSGAVLKVRGVPQDADVYGIVIKRGGRWLGPEGWSNDPIETPVRKTNGDGGTILLALSEGLAAEIPVGANLNIQIPGHDVSDTIIWRSIAPSDNDGQVTRKPTRRAAPTTAPQRQISTTPIAIAAIVAFAAIAGLAFLGQFGSDTPRTATDTSIPQVAVTEISCPNTPSPTADLSEWEIRLQARNMNTSLREGRRLALAGDMPGARLAFADAACVSADAAMEAAIFFDRELTAGAAEFGTEGVRNALAFYQLAAVRFNRTDAASRLRQLQEKQAL